MAKLKIGNGIEFRAVLPEKVDVHKSDDTTKKVIDKIQQELGILQEQITSNQEDILGTIDFMNKLDMKSEIKEPDVTIINKDHAKDFEMVYDVIYQIKREFNLLLNKKVIKLQLKLNKLQTVNMILGVGLTLSLLLHLL